MTALEWVQAAGSEGEIRCHRTNGSQCAGAATYRANVGKLPRNQGLLLLPKDREHVFDSPVQFMAYHKASR